MKPPPFEYAAPRKTDEALALLAQHGDHAKVLAGGQSLLPLLTFRLAQPEVLVDVNRGAELAYVRPVDGGLAIGALTRQHALERSEAVRTRLPIVAEACRLIGHLPIRHRGTLGGNLATDGIGSGYDLVWCSSVLHFVPDAAAVVAKVFDALAPGGVFVCAHAEVDDTPEAALRTLPYYLPMRLLGRSVTRRGELQALLAQAGFERIERIESREFPMAPLAVLIARKAAP